MNTQTLTTDVRTRLRAAWAVELDAARAARSTGDTSAEWTHLERAHILSQPMAGAHVRTHVTMLDGGAAPPRPARTRRSALPGHRRRTRIDHRQVPGRQHRRRRRQRVRPHGHPRRPAAAAARHCGGIVNHTTHDTTDMTATFSTDVTGLAEATRPAVVALDNGATYELRIAPVAKNLGDDRVRMLSYNGSIPGPTLRVRQGSEVVVQVRNDGDTEATVHWHGLRLDNAYDGVPFETQPPIGIGGEFTYRLRFPDAGLYWYHPHIREDYGLDMGLYGNIVVEPADADYWPDVDREVVVTLDDILVEDGRIAAFHEAGPTHVAMGRFGNVMLTGGETNLALRAQVGEVVRFYFTNTANTRLFNVALRGARMKLVGGDSGRYEHERFVDEVLLAPSERAVVDVRFDRPGTTPLEHRTPGRTYTLGTVEVADTATRSSSASAFEELRTSDELTSWRARLDDHIARRPDKTLAFKSRMPLLYDDTDTTAAAYTCPMHPDVVSTEPGTCPQCGVPSR